jgi:DNA-binding NarL/FixJ family response regulator
VCSWWTTAKSSGVASAKSFKHKWTSRSSATSDGADAVRKAREHRPDIVLLDITMPVMNGFEAARRIKHELPSTLILMVSQFDSAPFQREAITAGASGYVVKSNAASELIPALRKLHSQHAANLRGSSNG